MLEILQNVLEYDSIETILGHYESEERILDALRSIGESAISLDEYLEHSKYEKLKQRIFDASLRPEKFQNIHTGLRPSQKTPKDYQETAISNVLNETKRLAKVDSRASISAACGCGKSYISFQINEETAPKLTVYFVPTLTLMRQTLRDWHRDFQSINKPANFLAVGSSGSFSALNSSRFSASRTMSKATVSEFIYAAFDAESSRSNIIFATYDSQEIVTSALKDARLSRAQIKETLAFFDEAHNLTGDLGKQSAAVIRDKKLKFGSRIFMSGSPKEITFSAEQISSYDEKIFGKIVFELTFAEAIQRGILADYTIDQFNRLSDAQEIFEIEKEILDAGIANPDVLELVPQVSSLLFGLSKYPELRKIVAFHSTIETSQRFSRLVADAALLLQKRFPSAIESLHIDGQSQSAATRVLRQFESRPNSQVTLINNSKYFVEGINIPSIDGVFIGSARSTGSTVAQIVGRATRLSEDGKIARFLVPPPIASDSEYSESHVHMLLNLHYLRTAKTFLEGSIGTKQRELPIEAQAVFIETPEKQIQSLDELKDYFATSVNVPVLRKLAKLDGSQAFSFYRHIRGLVESRLESTVASSAFSLPDEMSVYTMLSSARQSFEDFIGGWKPYRTINVNRSR